MGCGIACFGPAFCPYTNPGALNCPGFPQRPQMTAPHGTSNVSGPWRPPETFEDPGRPSKALFFEQPGRPWRTLVKNRDSQAVRPQVKDHNSRGHWTTFEMFRWCFQSCDVYFVCNILFKRFLFQNVMLNNTLFIRKRFSSKNVI